jgi:hypothetical protein
MPIDQISGAIGAGLGIVGGIGKMFARNRANKDLKRLMGQDPTYQQNPIAAQRLALANQLFNARMPGASAVERNIYGTMGNVINAGQRNATDSTQALALASAAGGQAQEGFNQLGIQEAQDQQRRYQNLVGAQQGMIQEGDKVFGDETRRFENKVGMQGMINENRQNSWQELSNMGFGLSDFGMSGGFNGMFKKKQQPYTPSVPVGGLQWPK